MRHGDWGPDAEGLGDEDPLGPDPVVAAVRLGPMPFGLGVGSGYVGQTDRLASGQHPHPQQLMLAGDLPHGSTCKAATDRFLLMTKMGGCASSRAKALLGF